MKRPAGMPVWRREAPPMVLTLVGMVKAAAPI